MNKIGKFFKDHDSTILGITGMFGVLATAVVATVTTSKVEQSINKSTKQKLRIETVYYDDTPKRMVIEPSRPKFKEIAKEYWYYYIPTIGLGIATCVCIGLSDSLNKKRQAALIGVCAMTSETLRQYREIIGDEEDRRVKEEIAKTNMPEDIERPEGEELLFYEPITNQYFNATMAEIKNAEYHFERNYILRGYAEFSEFLDFLGIEITPESEVIGWSTWSEARYGYRWIDFEHDRVTTDDGLECYILNYPFGPHADYLED